MVDGIESSDIIDIADNLLALDWYDFMVEVGEVFI